MAERKRIGLIFSINKNWMGGTYYILNLINAINTLPDSNKPTLLLLCSTIKEYEYAKAQTHYPYLDYRLVFKKKKVDIKQCINKISRLLFRRNLIHSDKFLEHVDAIFPITSITQLRSISPLIYWIPDFQEVHYPEFFKKKELLGRKKKNEWISKNATHIVFSSQDAANDFNKNYRLDNDVKTHILHFSSAIPYYNTQLKGSILKKFKIDRPFFFCANQMWKHKNHMTLFKAINELKRIGYDPLLVCSGGNIDYRNKKYSEELLKFIEANELQENIILVGFIDRAEMICLMAESLAIIQPSLFEGWNTGIEEAKALNKYMIVSDINLHREQVKENAIFFDPMNFLDLTEKIKSIYNDEIKLQTVDYNISIKEFANNFMNIIYSLTNIDDASDN